MSILEKSCLLAKINFPRHLSPPLKRDGWQSTLSSTTFASSISNIPLFASGVLLTKWGFPT